jgi:FkbM family methyltransferase
MIRTVTNELARILSEPVSSVIDRERNALDRLLEESGRKVVLFGAGGLGKHTLACLRTIGIEPLAISDNDSRLWGTQLDGIEVVAPQAGAGRFGADAWFIVTIWNPFHWYSETRVQLASLGCTRIMPPSPVYWRFADTFLPFYCQDLPHMVYQHADAVLEAGSIWTDECSRREYLQQISWRASGSWTFRRPPNADSYFLSDVFELIDDEVFIDCGAFDGDTLRAYLSRRRDAFKYFVAIEPDRLTFAKLSAYVGGLPPALRDKISVVNCAVGAERAMIRFQDSGELGSKSSYDGTSQIISLPISELAGAWRPFTYVKMDIEGAEFDALVGARPVIERDRPVLAVCVYHTQHDIWRLPLLMKSMVPDYKMYLRCHEGDGWQTVAYAVPSDRVISRS